MKSFELFQTHYWQPFSYFGLTHSFFNLNPTTIKDTWFLITLLVILFLPTRILIQKKYPHARFVIMQFVKYFSTLTTQTLGQFHFNHFAFVMGLFIFIFMSSLLALVPGVEEPTKDLNTTLALGIISFVYTQWHAIRQHSLLGYIKQEFLSPLLLLPLHIVGKIATVVSISFRLFGNIFGGATITEIYFSATKTHWLGQLLALTSGLNFIIYIFFGMFEGFLQAFVFSMLTLTYLSIILEDEPPEMTEA